MTIEANDKKYSPANSQHAYFDEYGRCTPSELENPVHHKTRRYFQVPKNQPDLAQSYGRLNRAFNIALSLSYEDFEKKVEQLISKLATDEQTKSILNGVMVPFVLPKAHYDDLGTALEDEYLPAVETAYLSVFPNYSFTNHAPKTIKNTLSVTPGSRHDVVLEKMGQDCIVGLYFPCMLEYSVPAAVEQIANMPDRFLLAGGVDTAAAFISMPSLLFREDGYPPLLWLTGLTSQEDKVGYHFEAYGYDLTFNRRVHLNNVAEYWASGITVIS